MLSPAGQGLSLRAQSLLSRLKVTVFQWPYLCVAATVILADNFRHVGTLWGVGEDSFLKCPFVILFVCVYVCD